MTTENTEDLPVEPPRPARTIKIAHLVMGLLFLGIVTAATSLNTGAIPWSGARYVGPILLVTVGSIGLLVTLATRNRWRERHTSL